MPGDTASFLSRLEHDRALQNFFAFFSDWQLRVISHLFLRDFALSIGHAHNRRLPAPRSQTWHYSPLTHNAILSVALAYSDNEHLRSREVREKFAKHAKLFLEAECRSATLSTVQGLAVLSSFHSGLAEQSEPCCILVNDTETNNGAIVQVLGSCILVCSDGRIVCQTHSFKYVRPIGMSVRMAQACTWWKFCSPNWCIHLIKFYSRTSCFCWCTRSDV